ncbi:MAG TPA: NADH-quinone oxidoreductase subunit J [Casimicrobiaceae bacterium]|nr:NADH-quinone oxidoreductase subunit J [Casimicrobiaceae bacterium]
MNVQTAIFYFFALIMIGAALRVVTARNPVHAALWLVLAFFTAAAIWLLMGAEFLAITLVLVYVGAVMVLFLFVVMMLDVNFEDLRKHFRSYLPVGLTVGILIGFQMIVLLWAGTRSAPAATGSSTAENTRALGRLMYVDYVYPFELAAVILLVAIVAAIALTYRRRRETKYQDPSAQVKVRRADRIRLIELPIEKRAGE